MQRLSKRGISFVLSFLLVLSFIPGTAVFADDADEIQPLVEAPETEVAEEPAEAVVEEATEELAAEPDVLGIEAAEIPATGFTTLAQAEEVGAAASVPEDLSAYEEGQIIIVLADKESLDKELASIEGDFAILSTEEEVIVRVIEDGIDLPGAPIALVLLPDDVTVEEALLEAANNEDIAFAQPNFIYHLPDVESVGGEDTEGSVITEDPSLADGTGDFELLVTPNDPKLVSTASGYQWWLANVSAFNAWDIRKAEGTVTVATLDSGARLDHVDLAGNISPYAWDAVYRWNQTSPGRRLTASVAAGLPNGGDIDSGGGHGTHVAGIIAAQTNNGKLGAGVSYNAKVLPVRVTDAEGATNTLVLRNAYTYLMTVRSATNLRVVNTSLGGYDGNDKVFWQAIVDAKKAGILTVCSAGNENSTKRIYPGDYDEVISVTAVNRAGVVTSYSDHNAYKDIAAPGGDPGSPSTVIWSLGSANTSTFMGMAGTSMASPIVAGAAALLFTYDATLTPDEVQQILYQTATDKGAPGLDPYYGYGIVNVSAALTKAKATRTPTYTVTYNANGGSVSPANKIVAKGAQYGTLATPLRPGYAFSGWYTAATGGTQVTATTTVTATANHTIYARWTSLPSFNGKIVTISSGLNQKQRIDIPGQSVNNGAIPTLYEQHSAPNQRFRLVAAGSGYYKIINIKSNKVLDISGGTMASGTKIIQWTDAGSANQLWGLVPNGTGYSLVSKKNNAYCLDTSGGKSANGTTIVLGATTTNKASQRFYLNELKPVVVGGTTLTSGTYLVESVAAPGKMLDVSGSSKKNGAAVLIYKKTSNPNQRFTFTYDAQTGYYEIKNVNSGLVLDVTGSGWDQGTSVIQYASHGGFNQRWSIETNASGNLFIRSAYSAYSIDLSGSQKTDGTKVIVWQYHGEANQQWKLVK